MIFFIQGKIKFNEIKPIKYAWIPEIILSADARRLIDKIKIIKEKMISLPEKAKLSEMIINLMLLIHEFDMLFKNYTPAKMYSFAF